MEFEVNHDEGTLPITVTDFDGQVKLVVDDGGYRTVMVMQKSELGEIFEKVFGEGGK